MRKPAIWFLARSDTRKPAIWFLARSDTNQPIQSQKQARSLKFWIKAEEGLYYPWSEKKMPLCSHMQVVGFRN